MLFRSNIHNLFDETSTDFEHTIPRSLSFDNSLANLTICDWFYNRHIKTNRLPTQLENYDKDALIKGQLYSAIKPRLQKWEQKVEQLKNNVEFWVQKSKQAQPGDTKNYAIRQKHLWKMEMEYWQDKLDRFTMTEVTSGFKHSQLNDTRLITKYAYHYLKSVFSKVEVQKGSVTSDFRKMLGVQSVDEKKDREKHSHHAIDAAILSLIPIAAKRDKMLELFYRIQEEKKLNRNTEDLEQILQKEIRTCQIGNVSNLSQYIEDNILINHISNDQTLTPAKRKMRQSGKVVWLRDENGKIKKDNDGKGIPKHWIGGDSIRGQLHKDTFYGAITQAIKEEKKDAKGNVLKDKEGEPILTFKRNDNGEIITTTELSYVVRLELKYKKTKLDKGFKDLADLKNNIVDKDLYKIIEKQCEGKSFKDACEEGLYMVDKKGNKVNRIRHVRCYDKSIKNPLSIKKQTNKSTKTYKQNYYAAVGDLYVMCKYVSKTQIPTYKIYSLFDVSENRKCNLEDIPKTDEQGNEFAFALKSGDTILLYKSHSEEVRYMSQSEQSERLYTILGFENPSRINLKRHLNAKKDNDLGKGESIKNFSNLPEKIRCSVNTLNFLVEGKDFNMNLDGTIEIGRASCRETV